MTPRTAHNRLPARATDPARRNGTSPEPCDVSARVYASASGPADRRSVARVVVAGARNAKCYTAPEIVLDRFEIVHRTSAGAPHGCSRTGSGRELRHSILLCV